MLPLTSAAVIITVSLVVPLVVNAARLPVPDMVGQLLAGVVIGPEILGWARIDPPVEVLSVVGLTFLLMLAGLEIDVRRLQPRLVSRALISWVVSFVLALAVGAALSGVGVVHSPILIAVILSAASLGIVLPVLRDAGKSDTAIGQVVIAGGSIAEVVPILLLSVLFSADGSGIASPLVLLVAFIASVAVISVALAGVEKTGRLTRTLLGLQETTAEIRVRGSLALLMLFAALATRFGLEAVLGAFLAGVTLSMLDQDPGSTHALFRVKLRAVGFGVFVPFFLISTGMSLDVRALVVHPATLTLVPVFLTALFLVRALPAVLYEGLARRGRQLLAAGLFQATSLSVPVVAGSLGVELGLISPSNYAALVVAGVLSVVIFPIAALRLVKESLHPVERSGLRRHGQSLKLRSGLRFR